MATIKDCLFKIVTENGVVAAYITTGSQKRMYPIRTPDNTPFPAISYMKINKDGALGDRLDGPSDLTSDLFAFNIWAKKIGPAPTNRLGSEAVEEIGQKLKALLNGFKGTILAVDIQKISLENETDGWEPDLELYRISYPCL